MLLNCFFALYNRLPNNGGGSRFVIAFWLFCLFPNVSLHPVSRLGVAAGAALFLRVKCRMTADFLPERCDPPLRSRATTLIKTCRSERGAVGARRLLRRRVFDGRAVPYRNGKSDDTDNSAGDRKG